MKQILIASYNLDFGGIEKALINLLNNINLDKYKVTLVLEHKEGIYLKDVPSLINIKEYKVSTCKIVFIRKTINLIKRLNWFIKNHNKYDASICYATYSGPCSFVARTSSKNKIMYVHSNYYEAYNKDKNKVINFFDNLKINDYNHIVFVSNESKDKFNKIYPNLKEKTLTINNIVDVDNILELSKEKININKNNKTIFTFVGRLDESSKRLTVLLDVARKCEKDKVNAEFWIIGSGPDEDMYKKDKLSNVIFFGSKKNPYPYIKNSDYVILTSRYEGFPVVYNEAIALNKPIITTIDVSDDFISIPNRFGYVVKDNEIFKKVKELTNKKETLKEKVDYKKLNKNRINMLERILDND